MITGDAMVKLARTRIGQEYKLGSLAPKDDNDYQGAWDCAEFASWLVFQVAGKLYGCNNNSAPPSVADAYTGYWKRDAGRLGKIIPLEEAAGTPGAAVLRAASEGLIGHIVISDGKGGTIEAHSKAKGVIASTLSGRRWDYGILVPGISYSKDGVVDVEKPGAMVYRLSNPLMVSTQIGQIQEALKSAGYKHLAADNIYGHETAKAVEAFQQERGLVADGEVGAMTARELGIGFSDRSNASVMAKQYPRLATGAFRGDAEVEIEFIDKGGQVSISLVRDGVTLETHRLYPEHPSVMLREVAPGDLVHVKPVLVAKAVIKISVPTNPATPHTLTTTHAEDFYIV